MKYWSFSQRWGSSIDSLYPKYPLLQDNAIQYDWQIVLSIYMWQWAIPVLTALSYC